MTKYEIEVIKKFLNEAMRQLDAEVPGQTIIPGYADTDSSKVYLSEEGWVSRNVPDYVKNKFIKLPDDLKEKYEVVGFIIFDEGGE